MGFGASRRRQTYPVRPVWFVQGRKGVIVSVFGQGCALCRQGLWIIFYDMRVILCSLCDTVYSNLHQQYSLHDGSYKASRTAETLVEHPRAFGEGAVRRITGGTRISRGKGARHDGQWVYNTTENTREQR